MVMPKSDRVTRPTSRDVARLAGVSHTTVSFVVNGVHEAEIPEETRARVLRAVAQLDYHPHEAARSLRSRASRLLGLAIPEAYSGHQEERAAAVEAYAQSKGYSVFRSVTNFDAAAERRCFQWLTQRRFDALILAIGSGRAVADDVRALARQGYCITGLGLHEPDIDGVALAAEEGERQVVEHLATLGHRRIGYIYGVFDHDFLGGRLAACLALQRARGLPVDERWVRRCGPTMEDGYRETGALLDACAGTDRPTALIVVNDLLAGAVLAALYAAGISVPDAMSVASFDNTPQAAYTIPPLTSVDADVRRQGELAAQLTIERLANPRRPLAHLETRARLVVRASTGPAPAAAASSA